MNHRGAQYCEPAAWAASAVAWAGAVVLALLLTAGCATQPAPFPPEPKVGTRFHSFTQPKGAGPFPAVVLLHTCAGVRPHLYNWMRVLEANGYASIIVDSFSPRGGGACRIPTYFPASLDQVTDDAIAALEHLRSRPGIDARQIGAMGFSYGASAALRLASPRYHRGVHRFGAAVSFYPLCTPSFPGAMQTGSDNLYGDIDTPTLILMGEADNDTPSVVANCVGRVESLRTAGRPIRIKLFPGAGHVFDVYDREATRDATAEMLRFLDEELGRNAPSR